MRPRDLFLAIALGALPVFPAHAAVANEVTMHIVGVGTAMPDTIILPVSIETTGKTPVEAQAVNRATTARITASVIAIGVDAKDITINTKASADASDVAIAVDSSQDSAEAQTASSSSSMQIMFGDVNKLSAIQTVLEKEKSASAESPIFITRNIEKARTDAINDAIKMAQSDAAHYADTLGYRVVRITRISNQKASLNLPDAIQFVQSMEAGRGLSKNMVPTYASIEIDYVVVAK
jgi:uncharacterized protein YggE